MKDVFPQYNQTLTRVAGAVVHSGGLTKRELFVLVLSTAGVNGTPPDKAIEWADRLLAKLDAPIGGA